MAWQVLIMHLHGLSSAPNTDGRRDDLKNGMFFEATGLINFPVDLLTLPPFSTALAPVRV